MRVAHTAGTEVEAVLLKGILEEAGIPVMVRRRRIVAYELASPALDWSVAWGDLLVPDNREAEARDLVAGYLASLKEDSLP